MLNFVSGFAILLLRSLICGFRSLLEDVAILENIAKVFLKNDLIMQIVGVSLIMEKERKERKRIEKT